MSYLFDFQPFGVFREINFMANIWVCTLKFIFKHYKYASHASCVRVSKALSLFFAHHLPKSEAYHLHLPLLHGASKCMIYCVPNPLILLQGYITEMYNIIILWPEKENEDRGINI